MERRLAAVLIADVAGYSRLSQADEEGTRTRFQDSLKRIFEPRISEHRGRLVKTMGDGILVEFGSVVNALRCAVDIQHAEAEANGSLPPDQRLEFRIAINLGDVIVEGENIHGTGVNIADRLQALARPGGVVISGTAYDQVTNKLDVGYEFLGEQRVKNIPEPVRVYGVLTGAASVRPTAAASKSPALKWRWQWGALAAGLLILIAAGGVLWLRPWGALGPPAGTQASVVGSKPSLVVLPFDNLSDDKEQGYLADGITEDLTTELARIPGLFVISRNSAFSYKGKDIDPARVAEDLGVRYLLEGSIRRTGGDMRINAQLIDGQSGGHLWAERFDGAWRDVFSLQDQVVGKVAAALKLRLISGPRSAEAPGATTVPAACDLLLRAYGLDYGKAPAEVASLLGQAVALDSNFGQAWAELAWVYWMNLGIEAAEKALGTPNDKMVGKIKEYLSEAEKRPSSSYYSIMVELQLWQRKSDEAIDNAERAIALDPSNQWPYEGMSMALVLNGRAADARHYLDAANSVDPRPHAYRHLLAGLIAFSMDRFDDAILALEKAAPRELSTDHVRRQRLYLLTAAHAHLGHTSEAASARTELEAMRKNVSSHRAMHELPFKQRADMERLRDGLRKAGLPDFPFGYQSKDQLTGEEVRSLVFGHELRGRQVEPGRPYVRTTTTDGSAKVSTEGGFSSAGMSRIEGDFVCTLFEIEIETTCAAIFRNPRGTPVEQNEYAWVVPNDHLLFSRVRPLLQ